jgi:hypothetical protein
MLAGMRVFTFQSEKRPEYFGWSPDESSANLPAYFAPWRRLPDGGWLPVGTRFAWSGNADIIRAAVAKTGYYVAQAGGVSVPVIVARRALPPRA